MHMSMQDDQEEDNIYDDNQYEEEYVVTKDGS